MKYYEKLSLKLIDFLSKNLPSKSDEELEVIRYGIEVIFVNLFKYPILLILAYILGIFNYTLITMVSFSLIRTFAAGMHARKSWTCLLFSILTFFSIVYASKLVDFPLLIKNSLFLISFILIILYAPADTEEKPYISKKLRKKLKILSLIMSVAILIISSLIDSKIISSIFMLSLFCESILITPFAYKLFNRRYRNYEYY